MASLKKLPASKLALNKAIVNKTIVNKKASLLQQLQSFLARIFSNQQLVNPKLVLAFSGGLDSCVLLHLLAQVKKTLPFQLTAHHVHHGLSPNADAWSLFCKDVCDKLNVPLTTTKVQIENNGLGIEASARLARYKVLLDADADFICLAQHQDDQAETFLLQLARGAGVKGLAAMATENGKLLRPLLDGPRKASTHPTNGKPTCCVSGKTSCPRFGRCCRRSRRPTACHRG